MPELHAVASDKPVDYQTDQQAGQMANENVDRFLTTFERSARRWEIVVYPALIAFIVLAGYGFFLIMSLTKDMHKIASAMDPKMAHNLEVISTNIVEMGGEMKTMTKEFGKMNSNVTAISGKMDALEEMKPLRASVDRMQTSVSQMDANIGHMNQNVGYMANSTARMGQDMTHMTRSVAPSMRAVSGPMSMMSGMMPW